jgi:hypothetical protein
MTNDNFSFLDSQKSAFTFGDKNAFVSLNVSSIKELKLKFKSSKYHKNSIIASIQSSKTNNITVGSTLHLMPYDCLSISSFYLILQPL